MKEERSQGTMQIDVRNYLKSLNSRDFLNFGVQHVAYVRAVKAQGRDAYAIHAADGTALTVMGTFDEAIVVIRHNDLEPVTVH